MIDSEKDINDIQENKRWAFGIDQREFERQWELRGFDKDLVPMVDEWVLRRDGNYNGVDGLFADNIEADPQELQETPKLEKPEKLIRDQKRTETFKSIKTTPQKCPGCGKQCRGDFGLRAHMRHCKKALTAKVE